MVRLRRKCNICPTEKTWAEAKEKMHEKAEKMPFATKLKVLDSLARGELKWRKTKARKTIAKSKD